MLATLDHSLRGLRDRAILLFGFAGGLRRSEIVGLDCGPGQTEDASGFVAIEAKGALVQVKGKTGWREVEIGRGSSERPAPSPRSRSGSVSPESIMAPSSAGLAAPKSRPTA